MINKKQMLMLMLGASTMGALYGGGEIAAAIEQKKADLSDLSKAAVDKFKETVATLNPLLQAFVAKVNSGDFSDIEQDLRKVNLTPAIEFLINNMDTIQEKLIGFVKALRENVPADSKYQAVADSIASAVEEKLGLLSELKANLEVLKPYGNLAAPIIADALKSAHNKKMFRDSLDGMIKALNAQLKSDLAKIKNIDGKKIEAGLDSITDLYAEFQNGTLSLKKLEKTVVPAIGEVRKKLLPVAPAIASELAATALEINNAFISQIKTLQDKHELDKTIEGVQKFVLSPDVQKALERINEIGAQLEKDFSSDDKTGLNNKIDELKNEVF